jgi:hypothetical protein
MICTKEELLSFIEYYENLNSEAYCYEIKDCKERLSIVLEQEQKELLKNVDVEQIPAAPTKRRM